MRTSLAAAMATALLLLFAVRTYAFEPQWFSSLGLWVALSCAAVATFWVFIQMDRNATLSAIAGTDQGKVTFDRNFYSNLLTYVVLPLAAIAATQFSQVGQFLGTWVNPMLRLGGGG
jgi:hypothetical protein